MGVFLSISSLSSWHHPASLASRTLYVLLSPVVGQCPLGLKCTISLAVDLIVSDMKSRGGTQGSCLLVFGPLALSDIPFQIPQIFCYLRIVWPMSWSRTLQSEGWALSIVSLWGSCLFRVFVRFGYSVCRMQLRLAISVFSCRRRNSGLRFRVTQTIWHARLCCRLVLRLGHLWI